MTSCYSWSTRARGSNHSREFGICMFLASSNAYDHVQAICLAGEFGEFVKGATL